MIFEESISKGVFTIPWCPLCDKATWPPSESCHRCHADTISKPSAGCGRIIEYSMDDQGYFCIAEFEESVRIMHSCVAYGGTRFSLDDNVKSHMVKSVKNLFQSTPMLKPSDINGVLISTNENSKYLAAEISELFGLQPNHAYSVENLCSSGSNAVFSAFSNIRAGLADVILVIGADKHDGPGKILDTDSTWITGIILQCKNTLDRPWNILLCVHNLQMALRLYLHDICDMIHLEAMWLSHIKDTRVL